MRSTKPIEGKKIRSQGQMRSLGVNRAHKRHIFSIYEVRKISPIVEFFQYIVICKVLYFSVYFGFFVTPKNFLKQKFPRSTNVAVGAYQ